LFSIHAADSSCSRPSIRASRSTFSCTAAASFASPAASALADSASQSDRSCRVQRCGS
jgi:hypothetical protein